MAVRLQYSFDEASGAFLEAGGGPSGTLSGVGSRTTGHGSGSALTSSSGAPGGTVTGSPVIASSTWTAVTVMAWIQRSTAGGDCLVLWAGGNPDPYDMAGVKFASSGSDAGGWVRTNSTVNELTAAHAVGSGQWMHVAVTWGSGTLRVFVNGSQITSGSLAGSALLGNLTLLEVMGSNNYGWNSGPSIPIDDVRVFDSAEDAASITSWMNTPVGGSAAPALQDLILPPRTYAAAGRW